MSTPSRAALRMNGEAAFVMLARAKELEREGKSIIHLEIGQPDFPTPPGVVEAGIASLQRGETGYAPTLGLPALRLGLAEKEGKKRGSIITPESIAVVPGAKTALFVAMASVLDEGDEVIYPDPAFPAYRNISNYLGASALPLPLIESKGFSFDRDVFARLVSDKTKLVVLNSPSNPTGGVIPKEDLAFIAELAVKHDFWILSDEIYDELSFENEVVPSIYDFPGMAERTLMVNGFSKTYAMPGWRLGYLIVPETLRGVVENLCVNLFSCTATFTQYAALAALEEKESIESMREEYRARRDYLVEALNTIPGISCQTPSGAFYVFPNITGLGLTSAQMADHILIDGGVALLAGTGFGPYGEGYLRLSYATSMTLLIEAVERIRQSCARLQL